MFKFNFIKKLETFLAVLPVIIFAAVMIFNIASAQREYQPLEPLPGMTSGQKVNISQYFGYLFTFGITLGAALAVIMIVIGGVQYMISGGSTGKIENAKDRIWGAIWGLLLVLCSYMILEIINPDLVHFSMLWTNPSSWTSTYYSPVQ